MPPSLADTVAEWLREEIRSGRAAPGSRLPPEQRLASAHGVSRPVVREALGRLRQDGLVVTRQGAGAFVAEAGATTFRLDIADLGDRNEIRDIIELLMAFEAAATGLAAERRTDAQRDEIQAQLAAMQAAVDRGAPGVDEDVAFHRAIVAASQNPYFVDMADFLDRRVRRFIRAARTNSARLHHLPQAVQAEHEAIYEAVVRQDVPAARRAAEIHLSNAADRLALYLAR